MAKRTTKAKITMSIRIDETLNSKLENYVSLNNVGRSYNDRLSKNKIIEEAIEKLLDEEEKQGPLFKEG